MGHLNGIYTYPLTGARAVDHTVALMGPAGLFEDRAFVAYDIGAEASEHRGLSVYERVSQKQARSLAQIGSASHGGLVFTHQEHGMAAPELVEGEAAKDATKLYVNEFGDLTPAYDAGDALAALVRNVTGRQSLRVARKTDEWLAGQAVAPSVRRNAPIHIITRESLEALQTKDGAEFPRDRVRASLVVRGFMPFEENTWIDRCVQVGDVTLRVTRPTERCSVPGNDQQTGANMRDLPRFPRPEDGGKGVFGVYAYPEIAIGSVRSLALASRVEVIEG